MKKILNLFVALFTLTGLTSCLDEDPVFEGDNAPNVIEILYAGTGSNTAPADAPFAMYENALQILDPGKTVEIPVYINYAGSKVAPEDITVTVSLDPSIVDTYNTKVGTNYVLLPEDLYEIPSMTVTIPKGERTVTVPIKVETAKIDLSKSFALGMTITNVSTGIVSGNFKSAVLKIGAKNDYEATYKNKFSRTRADGSVIVSGNNEVYYKTTGQYSIVGNLIGYYSNQQTMTLDPATNKVTVTSPGIAISQDKSYYDPETKTFYIDYVALNTSMKSTLVRKGE
ncbi:DUF1735 domain-containing protein [Pontibacter sp. H249]|uniref:DUF1735 domain-containing protein n=1 Tax=Pontibacter sp. H249 TaxID=3133420 RepID=UPI0030C54D11